MRLRSAALAAAFAVLSVSNMALAAPAAPPSSQIVVSHGHKIAYHVYPGRQPAIVLDAGGGNDSTYWESFVPQLAKATGAEIVTYDRSGLGASGEVLGPWDGMG